MKKRFLSLVLMLTLLTGLLGGGSVAAADETLTFNDLVTMTDTELRQVPQATLQGCLDALAEQAKSQGARFNKIAEKDFNRVYQQWLANCERATLDSIYGIPLPEARSIDTVTIGTDVTVDTAEYGYYSTGGAQSLATYDVSEMTQEAVTAIVGAGSSYGSAYTGFTFYVEGNATTQARVDVSGYMKALAAMTPSFGYGSAEVKYELVIEKISGTAYEERETIKRINGYFQVCDNYFTANTNYYFAPENWYRITMVVHASASWIGLGEALADAYYPSEYSQWFEVNIDWY